MAEENKGGPRAQAVARTIFPNTGGTIIGGVGGVVVAGPVQVLEQKPRQRRVLPPDVMAAKLEKLVPSFVARVGEERVSKMREGQAKVVLAHKTANAPDDDR